MRWMARQLWLLRHGEAEPHDVRSDDERRLTSRGEDQSRAAGRALAALEVTFQAVYTSPKGSLYHLDGPRESGRVNLDLKVSYTVPLPQAALRLSFLVWNVFDLAARRSKVRSDVHLRN